MAKMFVITATAQGSCDKWVMLASTSAKAEVAIDQHKVDYANYHATYDVDEITVDGDWIYS